MRVMVFVLFGVLFLPPTRLEAQSDRYADRESRAQVYRDKMSALYAQVPANIANALDQLHHNYYEQAEKQIFAFSRSPANGSLASAFRANRERDGEYQGCDVVSVQQLTPRLRIVYLALDYEKAPHFLKFTLYSTAEGWIVLRSSWVQEDDFETTPVIPAETTPTQ